MARYRIEFTAAARRQFDRLDPQIQRRLRPRIDTLADDPLPHNAEHLHGPERFLRIRVGEYRVVYSVHHDALLVLVVTLGHRREVYRDR